MLCKLCTCLFYVISDLGYVHLIPVKFSTCWEFVLLDVPFTQNHANCKKIWMPNHLKMWTLKSRSYFLPVQSKIWTARCHRDRLNFSPAEAWLHGCVVTRGRLQTDIGFTNRKFNQHCVNVALRTNLKKDDVQHNGLFQMLPDTWVF